MIDKHIHRGFFEDVLSKKSKIDRDKLSEFLYINMKDITLEELVGYITNKYDEIIEYVELCEGKKTCQRTSLLFNPYRLNTRTKKCISIYEALHNKPFYDGLARASLFKKGKVTRLLYQILQLGINGVKYVNEFPPHVARDLAFKYGLNRDSKVLDPCGGWGGRMIGFSVVVNNYETFEPAIWTYEGLIELCKFIQIFRKNFQAIVHNIPYEDSILKKNYYDFALTSPPYYDSEEYSKEETDSAIRYKTFDAWKNDFYIPLIEKTIASLKKGCYFILNIGCRQYPLDEILMKQFRHKNEIKLLENFLSGKRGMGKEGKKGELFYEIKK